MATIADRVAFVRRFGVLDWIRIGLFAFGVLCVITGLLPGAEARTNLGRIAPLVLFLGSVIVLAKLAKEAGVFDVLATRFAILAGGNYLALFLLCVGLAVGTTTFLNLDTTAVLLTPVLLALGLRVGIPALPLGMTALWLANTASNLLPVANLTNLLASDRVALDPTGFAVRMWAPQLAAMLATMAFLWFCFWRRPARERGHYVPPEPVRVADRSLFWTSAFACVGFVGAMLALGEHADGLVWVASSLAAMVVVLGFWRRDRSKLSWSLIPWWLLVFLVGLFLVVPTMQQFGLGELIGGLIGDDDGAAGMFRAAALGAGLSNLVNNLPAYVAGEAAVADANHDQLLALLVGTNVGPIVTPWASLATLLCFEAFRYYGVDIPIRRFVLLGLGLAVVGVTTATAALLLTGH